MLHILLTFRQQVLAESMLLSRLSFWTEDFFHPSTDQNSVAASSSLSVTTIIKQCLPPVYTFAPLGIIKELIL